MSPMNQIYSNYKHHSHGPWNQLPSYEQNIKEANNDQNNKGDSNQDDNENKNNEDNNENKEKNNENKEKNNEDKNEDNNKDKNNEDKKNNDKDEEKNNDKDEDNNYDDDGELISRTYTIVTITEDDDDDEDWKKYREKYGTCMSIGPLGVYDALDGPVKVYRFGKPNQNEDSIRVKHDDTCFILKIHSYANPSYGRNLEMNDDLRRSVIRFNSYANYLKEEAKLSRLELELENTTKKLKEVKYDISRINNKLNICHKDYRQKKQRLISERLRREEQYNLEHELEIETIDNKMRALVRKIMNSCEEYVAALTIIANRDVKNEWRRTNFFKDGVDIKITKLKCSLLHFFSKYDSEGKVSSERKQFEEDLQSYYDEVTKVCERRNDIFDEHRRSDRLRQLRDKHEDNRNEEEFNYRCENFHFDLNNLNEQKTKLKKQKNKLSKQVITSS